ncbi:MAG: TIGR02678 family protein [Streptosporangiales bacterium]|nr:TIGR02678 family protein [Streptosporangiales bacterium]
MTPPQDDVNLLAERREAVRLLLREPLITAESHPEQFPLLRRHAEWLAREFSQVLGYRLVVEAGFARLEKAGLGFGSGRALEKRSGAPFTPRTYAYLALVLSALVTAPEQILLSELVTQVRTAAAEAGLRLEPPHRAAERRALVAALHTLTDWRVLAEDEGAVGTYADNADAEALLTIDREIARRLIATMAIGKASDPGELVRFAADPGPGGPRHRVRRLLVETPVVYLDDLTVEERHWLRTNQRREADRLETFCGLEAEIRAEGIAMLDPEDDLSDVEFPGNGTLKWAALLLVERFATELRPEGAGHRAAGAALVIGVPIPDGLAERILAELVQSHGRGWSERYTADIALFTREVLDLLRGMGLIGENEGLRADDGDAAHAVPDRVVTDVRGARGDRHDRPVLLAAAARYATTLTGSPA